jgi:hypothetical protein
VVAERIGIIILSAFVAHTAWYWMAERWGALREVDWPAFTAGGAASTIRWLMVFIVLTTWCGCSRNASRRATPDSPKHDLPLA